MTIVKDLEHFCGSYQFRDADKLGLHETGYLILDEQKNFIPLNIALLTLHYKGNIPKGIVFTHYKKPACLHAINELYPLLSAYFGKMDYRFFNIYVYLDKRMRTDDDKVGYRIDVIMKENPKITDLYVRMLPIIEKIEDELEKAQKISELGKYIENMEISV